MKIHEKYINRCIEIGKNGLGNTRPNPMVGCVIVHNDLIIGEAFTSPYGGKHAEVNAIESVKNYSLLKESTLYVTLEPCSHHGKTPPCSDFIIEHNIPNIVIGCLDDNIKVAGNGVKKLKDSGCDVIVGVLEQECKDHHKRFFTYHNKKRPYIILKWAETKDGFIAPLSKQEKKPVWISNKYALQLVHKLRAEEHSILVGTNTVLEDNPTLTVRDWTGQNPIRVVIDKNEKLSKSLNIFNREAKTIIISERQIDFDQDFAQNICNTIFEQGINSIIIEGGRKTLQAFIDANLWDEARVFRGALTFENGIKAPSLSGTPVIEHSIIRDTLNVYRND